MRTIRTLVTVCRPEDWHSAYQGDLPPEIDLVFSERHRPLADQLGGVEILYGDLPLEALPKADKLRWVQVNSTGADQMLYEEFVNSGILLTSLGGAITGTVAEHALALLFALARNLHLQRDLQRAKEWKVICGVDIEGMRLGILGLGKIGRAIAARAQSFGMEIAAVDVNPVDKPEYVRTLRGLDHLHDLLRHSDALLCAVPKTPATKHLIAARQIAMMPRGSFIVNISRGAVVDEDALVEAVRGGHIAGAGIDVTAIEPCPADSPLWTEPRILLTPHSAGFTPSLLAKKTKWFVDNLKRYVAGESLQGLIHTERGF